MINFRLRSLAIDDDRRGCRFDATPAEFGLIGDGTPVLIRDFLSAMHIDAEAASWTVEPFCTYYYAQSVDSPDFRYVFIQSFALRVRFTSAFEAVPADPFLQYFASETDPTWDANRLPFSWERQRLIIVADCFRRTPDALLASLRERPILQAACRSTEIVRLHPNVLQMRMDVGEVVFPGDLRRASSLMEEASHFCRAFLWTESVTLGA